MESKKFKHYTVYQTTNIINGDIYVGQHKTNNLRDRYLGSGTAFMDAVLKYGRKSFSKKILFVYDNFEEMNDKEREIVNEEFIARPDTYNNVIGGGGRDSLSLRYTKEDFPDERLAEMYDPKKTVYQNAIVDKSVREDLRGLLMDYVVRNDIEHVPHQMSLINYRRSLQGLDKIYSDSHLASIYDPTKTLMDLSTSDGRFNNKLFKHLIRYVKEYNLPCVDGQKCLGHSSPFTPEKLDKLYDPTKTILEQAGRGGMLFKWLVRHVVDNNLDYVPDQICIDNYKNPKPPRKNKTHVEVGHTDEYLESIYDENKTIVELSIVNNRRNTRLREHLIKFVCENGLNYVPGQKCIENYKKKHGITPVLHQFV